MYKKIISNHDSKIENNIKNTKINISIPQTKKEFFEIINNFNRNDVILINTLTFNLNNYFDFEKLDQKNIIWGEMNFLRYPPLQNKILDKIKLNCYYPHHIISKIINFYFFLLKVFRFKSTFKPHFEMINNHTDAKFTNTYKIKSHVWAYDDYLNYNNKKNENDKSIEGFINNNYILYVDENVPFHEDPFMHGYSKPLCKTQIFFDEINKFFNFIEKKFGKKVLIAGYPRSNYKKNYFDGRKIIYGNTISLVKNSQMVLMHNSTAVNYSIIYKKPIIFINSENYLLHYSLSIKALAQELNLTDVNITNDYNNIPTPFINIDRYNDYFKKYIKADFDNNEDRSYELFYKELSNIYSKCII